MTTRVLVAEDSVTARELLVEILRSGPELEVAGEAKNGLEAVEMTRRLRPDVVTMDVRMPRMDGFEATRQIMVESPTPIVIVSASLDLHESGERVPGDGRRACHRATDRPPAWGPGVGRRLARARRDLLLQLALRAQRGKPVTRLLGALFVGACSGGRYPTPLESGIELPAPPWTQPGL